MPGGGGGGGGGGSDIDRCINNYGWQQRWASGLGQAPVLVCSVAVVCWYLYFVARDLLLMRRGEWNKLVRTYVR